MERIGVRELRQHASRYLARVQAGETIEITDRGRLSDIEPLPAGDGPSLSGVLAQMRDDERC